MSNIFGNLDNDANIKGETDSLGGGFIKESGVYNATIELAYADQSTGGARSVNIHLKTEDGAVIRLTEYVTSGTAKGGLNTYVDQKTGEKRFLPGYSKMDSMSKLACAKGLTELTAEEKVVNRYDYDAKKELPMKTNVLTELMGQPITVGLVKQIVDKNAKNAAGTYEPTGETREENVADKFFRARDGMTATEIIAGATEPSFRNKWAEKNTGVTRNLAKGAPAGASSGATAGAPAAAPAAGEKPASLFGLCLTPMWA